MDPALEREARRLLARYQVEVVERYGLCPWARPARDRGEIRVWVVDAVEAGATLDAFTVDDAAVIGLVVLPRFAGDPGALRRLRDDLLSGGRTNELALADFHPEAALDVSAPARLVPWLRRSPDPMLQAVRHRTLASLRRTAVTLAPAEQARALAGHAPPPRLDPADAVAADNLAVVRARAAEVAAAFDDIARDRAATYGGLGVARVVGDGAARVVGDGAARVGADGVARVVVGGVSGVVSTRR